MKAYQIHLRYAEEPKPRWGHIRIQGRSMVRAYNVLKSSKLGRLQIKTSNGRWKHVAPNTQPHYCKRDNVPCPSDH